MSWVMVGTAAVTAVAGYAKSRSDKKAAAKANKEGRATTRLESIWNREESQFNAALEDYYTQKERATRQRGLDEFRKFNTMQEIQPGYTNTNPESRVEVPVMPNAEDAYDPNANKQGGSGGGKGGLAKLDPLGAKLIKYDPIGKKLLGGLF